VWRKPSKQDLLSFRRHSEVIDATTLDQEHVLGWLMRVRDSLARGKFAQSRGGEDVLESLVAKVTVDLRCRSGRYSGTGPHGGQG
jgi:hypothetical protein